MAASERHTARGRRRRSTFRSGKRARVSRKRQLSRLEIEARQKRYRSGFEEGYRMGEQCGYQNFGALFEGTSIVIPTYNQLELLRKCIASIAAHTETPYEIIVVDDASTDGTGAYLQGLGGQVRYRVLDANRGFSGAVNVGMMMAKGNTIALLNNDVQVTEGWLDHMLACLQSDESIGMVGPVTNYIGGEQQIEVASDNLSDMRKFARERYRSHAGQWQPTDRLVGFCLLFRRRLFEEIGYFDEGFEIGNYEDDDYNVRVRLNGKQLMIAQDTFVYHYGSASMRELGDRLREINGRNQAYYAEKWRNPNALLQQVQALAAESGALHAGRFYPEPAVVRTAGGKDYWIERGERRLIEGPLTLPAVRLSQVDLQRWRSGEPIPAEEAERKWRESDGKPGSLSGIVLQVEEDVYYAENGKLRPVFGDLALRSWHLHLKPSVLMSREQLADMERGVPIVPPPRLRHIP